jgi:predicted nucleic acid-binding protein
LLSQAKLRLDCECHIGLSVNSSTHKLQKILNSEESYQRTLNLLNSEYFEYYPVDQTTLKRAIELNYTSKMRINDAIIAQQCLDLKLDGIFTDNVKDFKKVADLHIINLR